MQAKRLGQTTQADDDYLTDLRQYIDEWQAREVAVTKKDDVWEKLDAIASELVAAKNEIARQNKK